MWLLAAYRRTHSPGRLAWSEGRQPVGTVPYSSYEPVNSRRGLSYDGSTINIVGIIIISIITIREALELAEDMTDNPSGRRLRPNTTHRGGCMAENRQQLRRTSHRFVRLRSVICRHEHPASINHFHHRRNKVRPSMKPTHQPNRLPLTVLPRYKTDSSCLY